jgi:2-polyprenyl-6-methoxyphenol hydroxylase-like FAD-dependent oxidoreductase
MSGVGIVGSGISGLQLALRLQQLGIAATVYSEHDIDRLKAGRPRNFPARFHSTQQRERELGVFDWDFADAQVQHWAVTMHTGGAAPLEFLAALRPPSSVVDFRIYLPHLLSAFVDRGGELVIGEQPVEDLARRHELLVVANGNRSIRRLFPVDPDRSPFTTPQRVLCSGIYHGIDEDVPHCLDIHFLPGAGEILRLPFYSTAGRADVLAFEAIPGGPLEAVCHTDADADPAVFLRQVLDLVAVHAPTLRERIDTAEFCLSAPGELIQGAITPVVRQGWTRLDEGTFALAIGDAWITNDPLTAQGANLASHTAFALADLLAGADGPYDEAFCREASARLWEHARHVVEWSNAFLGPPPPHVAGLFERAAADQRVADAFVSDFNDPVTMWRTLSTPDGAADFLARCEREPAAPPAADRTRNG